MRRGRLVPDLPTLSEPDVPSVLADGAPPPVSADRLSRRQIRGSSLLLFGRLISLGTNFLVQVMIVRYLSKGDYGVFAYALSVVNIAAILVTLGTDRAIGRFLPIYQEKGRPDQIVGAQLFILGTIASLGIASVLLVYGLQDLVSDSLVDPRAGPLLLILIVLAPIQAADDVLMNGFAVFSSPRSIFFRRFVLNPVMRLAVVGLLIATDQDAKFLAIGYVVSGAIGLVVYGVLFARLLRREGIVPRSGRFRVSWPVREILVFSIPLLSTDLINVLMGSMDVIILGAFTNAETVASYRVIAPVAALNLIVLQSFSLMYTPAASRLFAREDADGVRDLYWQTAAWVAVASFPIFALTFALAEPLTVLLFQERYASSAVFLAIIAVGRYFDAALGFNGLTVRVFGSIAPVVAVNVIAAVVNLILLFTLIPAYGALGAAIATGVTLFVFNCLKQLTLKRVVGIAFFDRRYVGTYAVIVASAMVLLVVQVGVRPPLWIGMLLVIASSAIVLRVGRTHLRLEETFPELGRLPVIRRMV